MATMKYSKALPFLPPNLTSLLGSCLLRAAAFSLLYERTMLVDVDLCLAGLECRVADEPNLLKRIRVRR